MDMVKPCRPGTGALVAAGALLAVVSSPLLRGESTPSAEEEKKRATRYNLPLSLIMVDIDWFKKVNDSYGHEIGNLVIKDLSRVINRCIRDVDIFVRYGGEEFVVILPQTLLIEASNIGERIRAQVEEMVVDTGQAGTLRITVSVGVTSYPENGRTHEEIVSVVDQALYRAKGSGKNLVCNV